MESINGEELKKRTVSSTSSASSSTEYFNEAFEDSELEMSKVVSIQVSKDDIHFIKNPLADVMQGKEHEPKSLKDFSDIQGSDEKSNEFIVKGFRKMYIAALTVLLFPVCVGMAVTYSATATTDMKKPHSSIHPVADEVTWIGSLMAIGALVGGTAGGYFSGSLGRKGALIFNTMPFVIGWLCIAYADTIGIIYTGRIITGFSCGIVSVATPMYLIEISTPEIRGLLGASFQLFVVIGVLIVSCLGSALNWRWLSISGAIMSLIAAFLMVLMPESPKWLMAEKRRGEAKNALTFLQGELYDAESECQVIEEEIKNQPVGRIQLKEFTAPTVYKPLLLSCLLMFFQQFSGVNAVLFYTVDIFEAAGVVLNPITATIIIAFVQVLATLAGSMLMDRAGRKRLLFASAVCMAVSLTSFGAYDFAKTANKAVAIHYGWVPVVSLAIFIAAFSIGYGPTPWLMVAEMTPTRFRSVVSGIATALNWTFVFIITKSFNAFIAMIHAYGVYWLYGGFCLCSIIVTHFFLPETKGKKMQEIEDFFK